MQAFADQHGAEQLAAEQHGEIARAEQHAAEQHEELARAEQQAARAQIALEAIEKMSQKRLDIAMERASTLREKARQLKLDQDCKSVISHR